MIDLSNWLDGRYAIPSARSSSPESETGQARPLDPSGLPQKDGPP